mmetsp:Transcript_38629/g.71184  ORF Transcript_38629/g.71184 Transcript_38629/m.71184 type:complete len:260 (+) Transcript_38629:153-932(+)
MILKLSSQKISSTFNLKSQHDSIPLSNRRVLYLPTLKSVVFLNDRFFLFHGLDFLTLAIFCNKAETLPWLPSCLKSFFHRVESLPWSRCIILYLRFSICFFLPALLLFLLWFGWNRNLFYRDIFPAALKWTYFILLHRFQGGLARHFVHCKGSVRRQEVRGYRTRSEALKLLSLRVRCNFPINNVAKVTQIGLGPIYLNCKFGFTNWNDCAASDAAIFIVYNLASPLFLRSQSRYNDMPWCQARLKSFTRNYSNGGYYY